MKRSKKSLRREIAELGYLLEEGARRENNAKAELANCRQLNANWQRQVINNLWQWRQWEQARPFQEDGHLAADQNIPYEGTD